MSSIDSLDINPRILFAVRKAGLKTFESVLSHSSPDLERATGLNHNDVSVLKTAVSHAIPVFPVTALDIYKGACPKEYIVSKLTTGCDVIDKALRGGLLSHGVTEIVGESASGKTQLCLQLCLNTQLPKDFGGLNGGAAYICTEDVFPNKRLHQMIQYFSRKTSNMMKQPLNFGDNIFIEHVSDIEGLTYCIQKRLPLLLLKGLIKLVVIDSVAALFRCEYEAREMVLRSKHLTSFGATLHKLSHQHSIPIVCVNQVTSSMNKEDKSNIPALGLTWSNQITCRIMLSRTSQQIMLPRKVENKAVVGGFETSIRNLEVIFAPHLPALTVPFVIDQEGVKDLV